MAALFEHGFSLVSNGKERIDMTFTSSDLHAVKCKTSNVHSVHLPSVKVAHFVASGWWLDFFTYSNILSKQLFFVQQ